MGYNLLIHGIYWGYNPRSKLLITNFLRHPSMSSRFGRQQTPPKTNMADDLTRLQKECNGTVDSFRNPGSTHQLRLLVYPSIYKVLYIPGGCLGFLSSTVFRKKMMGYCRCALPFMVASLNSKFAP